MVKRQLKDDFLGNLLKSNQTECPAPGFTAKVMDSIQKLEAEKENVSIWTPANILMVLAGIIVLVLLYFVVWPFIGDISLLSQGIDPEHFNRYMGWVMNFFQGFVSTMEFIRNSTLTLIILFVIPSLLVMDRLLKRLTSRTFLFII